MDGTQDCGAAEMQAGSRAEARRRKVIDTARKLFADNGFHATGIAQVAKQSGVAVGQIYRDFASKEDIVAEIVRRDCATLLNNAALEDAIARRDSQALRAWIVSVVDPEKRDDDGRMFAEILAESSRNARIHDIFQSVQGQVRANMLAALAVLAPAPAAVDRRAVLADTILTLSVGLIHHRLIRRHAATEDLAAALERIVGREIDDLAASR